MKLYELFRSLPNEWQIGIGFGILLLVVVAPIVFLT